MTAFSDLLTHLEARGRVILATILSTSGSTPASALSRMAIAEDGTRLSGTIGGGCVEADVLVAARKLAATSQFEILSFRLKEDEFVQGLICGGSLEVLLESLSSDDVPWIQELMTHSNNGADSILVRWLSERQSILKRKVWKYSGELDDAPGDSISRAEFNTEVKKAFRRGEFRKIKLKGQDVLIEPIAGNPSLVIFGGGHIGKTISRVASIAGFRITVVDDREEFANPQRFPEPTKAICASPQDALTRIELSPSSYIVIATRGHRDDEEILEMMVQRDVKYIGMIGSKRKVLTTYDRLTQSGIPAELLAKVHAPIGLEIGSANPEEIAISVVAELIAVRRGILAPIQHKSDSLPERRPLVHK